MTNATSLVEPYPADASVCAFLDIGTNSVRMLLVLVNADGTSTVIGKQKAVVRLGGGEFLAGSLQPDAMLRAAKAVAQFAAMARLAGAKEIVAVATAATREAHNQAEFLAKVRQLAGIDVRPISGQEEARLIYLGVRPGLPPGGDLALFVDIGGGSTELIVGDRYEHRFLDSMAVGAIRLTALSFAPDETGPVTPARYAGIQRTVRQIGAPAMAEVRALGVRTAVGSSGTIQVLAEIAARAIHRRPRVEEEPLTHTDLRAVTGLLCAMDLKERRRIQGINPDRADIIIAGAAILETLMADLELADIHISDRGLRDGLIVDYLATREPATG